MNMKNMELDGWQGNLVADSGHNLNTQRRGSGIARKNTYLIFSCFCAPPPLFRSPPLRYLCQVAELTTCETLCKLGRM
jgi:hypothetical protein